MDLITLRFAPGKLVVVHLVDGSGALLREFGRGMVQRELEGPNGPYLLIRELGGPQRDIIAPAKQCTPYTDAPPPPAAIA